MLYRALLRRPLQLQQLMLSSIHPSILSSILNDFEFIGVFILRCRDTTQSISLGGTFASFVLIVVLVITCSLSLATNSPPSPPPLLCYALCEHPS